MSQANTTMRLLFLLSAILPLTLAPQLAVAQRVADLNGAISLGTHTGDSTNRPTPYAAVLPASGVRRSGATRMLAPEGQKPEKWPYVLGGALMGATAAGVGFAINDPGDDAIFAPVVAAVGITVCGIVGAGLGWLTYHIVHGDGSSH